MAEHRIVVIGASAGGVAVLRTLVAGLPADLNAAVFIVLHMPPHTPSRLPEILAPNSGMPVWPAEDEQVIRPGQIYVAPPDHHLMLDRVRMRLTSGPKECRVRPAIDVLFRSAAAAYGPRAIGVVLTGMLDDGTAGLWAIKDRGGFAVVQKPDTAEHPSMPESAARYVAVDASVALEDMAAELVRLVAREAGSAQAPDTVPESMEVENQVARQGNALQAGVARLGQISPYTCPDCHGVLVQIREGRFLRFRCQTGHAFSMKTLLAEVNEVIDTGLWATLRAVEERVLLLKQFEELARAEGESAAAAEVEAQARQADAHVALLRSLVVRESALGSIPESG